jgi:hypothetical protein
VFQADRIGNRSGPGAIARGAEALGAVLAVIAAAPRNGWPRQQGQLDC